MDKRQPLEITRSRSSSRFIIRQLFIRYSITLKTFTGFRNINGKPTFKISLRKSYLINNI
jgi:hypothetical protein